MVSVKEMKCILWAFIVTQSYFHYFTGFGFDEDPAWFDWFHKYRNSMADKTLETELIPRLKDQGVVTKLGMVCP